MTTQVAKAARPGAATPANKPKELARVAPTPSACQPVSVDEIRLRAYLRWEAAGKPSGNGLSFWLEAEQELLQRT
jgi:hypothetical protein